MKIKLPKWISLGTIDRLVRLGFTLRVNDGRAYIVTGYRSQVQYVRDNYSVFRELGVSFDLCYMVAKDMVKQEVTV